MADKYITTKYGTRINVTGLTTEQINRVRSVAQDNGAYGSKGAALAKEMQKRLASKPNAPTPTEQAPTPTEQAPAPQQIITPVQNVDLGINTKTGAIDPAKAVPTVTGAEALDTTQNFNMNNPGTQTDIFGNTQQITRDASTGQVNLSQAGGGLTQGAQAFLQSAMGGAQNMGRLDLGQQIAALQGQRLDLGGAPQILQANDVRAQADQVANANYQYLTRGLADQKAQDKQELEQQLANRGIPLNFGRDNLYGRAMSDLDKKYQDLHDQANQQALMARDASLGALTGAQRTAYDAFLQGATTQYDAATGNIKDQAALGSLQAQNAQNQVGTAINAIGATQPGFTAYQGGTTDQSGTLAQLLQLISGQQGSLYGINQDVKTKMAAINKPTGGGGGGGSGSTGGGFAIGGIAP